jgi:hypothetical protein
VNKRAPERGCCNCRICKLLRAIEPLIARSKPAERKALDSILYEWEANSTSSAYWEMKFKKSWPEHEDRK